MKTNIAILAATFYLFFLSILAYTGALYEIGAMVYLISPLIVVGLVYVVLAEDGYDYPELGLDEEWGIRIKIRQNLGCCSC